MNERFDYIVVGGGAAGCILADRLTRSGRHRVLLVEAGDAPKSPWIGIPAGFSRLLTNPRYNWLLKSEPEAATRNRVISIPKGRGLGGSTLINGMIYVRGQAHDYDGWAQQGCTGWSHEDVLPYFQGLEDFQGPEGQTRGKGGPLPVEVFKERPVIARAFIDAAVAAGHPLNPDYNDGDQDGFGYYQVNNRGGRRVSAYDAYLAPALNRSNLKVLTNAHALRVLIDGKRATGVEIMRSGMRERHHADGEVILAAGGVHTPQLLELSGIGDPAVLGDHGIAPCHVLTGVGANYIDHFCTRMNWRVKQPVTLNEHTRGLSLLGEVLKYAFLRKGILTYGTGLVHGFMRTREGLAGPDVQLFFMHASYANAAERKLDRKPGMTVGVTQLRPQSRGTIHIQSADPMVQPSIRPNFLATAEDRRTMVEGMKMTRRVVEQHPMDAFRDYELTPGAACRTDEDWLAFAREDGQTIYHVCGTAKMGTGPDAVVSPDLKVHGLDGLRVVDASIMPSLVSGNTQAAVFMIAEKGSDLILNDAR